VGIGIDLIEVSRIEAAISRRPGFAERVFSKGELEYANSRKRPAMHLAARFAAKEAARKALGLGGLAFHEVEVVREDDGRPGLRLSGRSAERADELGVTLEVSLTHTRETGAAVVVTR